MLSLNNAGNVSDGGTGPSKEEEDLMGRNIKRMPTGIPTVEEGMRQPDAMIEDIITKTSVDLQGKKTQNGSNMPGSQISYKAKLLGEEEKDLDKSFEEQMREWLQEEAELAPVLTEDQKQSLGKIPSLVLPNERLKELCRPWKDALILTVLGKNTNLHMMKDRIKGLLRSDNFELIDLPNNYFVFRTTEKSLYSKLLFDGPWTIQGHYLAIQRWSLNFNPHCSKVKRVAVWIRVPTLPLHIYSEDGMYEIGNLIERTLKVDMNTLANKGNNTLAVERGKFARVSVEVDLNKKLQSRFMLRNHVYTVEYEGLSAICFRCGLYGHTVENCKLQSQVSNVAAEQDTQMGPPVVVNDVNGSQKLPLVSVPGVSMEEEYGTWMQVKPRARTRQHLAETDRRLQPKSSPSVRLSDKGAERGNGSRFNALQQYESEVPSKDKMPLIKKKGQEVQWKKKEAGKQDTNGGEGAIKQRLVGAVVDFEM